MLFVFLIGNFFFIIVFVRMKEKVLLVIVSMVVLDFLMVVFLFLCFIINEINGFGVFFIYGNGGIFLCKMCSFLGDMLLFVLILSMVVIVIECFFVVVYFV